MQFLHTLWKALAYAYAGTTAIMRGGFRIGAAILWLGAVALSGLAGGVTGTALAGHHQPLRVWVLCLYFMGLNLSNRQIALELGLGPPHVQAMTEQLRRGLVAKAPAARLEGEVEVDEGYGVAGHKGQPAAVAKRGRSDAVASWPARQAGARWRRDKPPILGLIQRGGPVVLHMVANDDPA